MSLIFNVEFSNEAKKYLKRQDKETVVRIFNAIELIRVNPSNHPNVKKMKGYEGEIYRLRVGGLRILFELLNDKIVIFIFKIGPRGDVYK
ncbi:type II toxin-antitoxin system RelE family toxin [Paenibacillus senegalensis]|uniref:type II toxin-antitoxin system RelE family toxin n=1 Tax=Paenibacillus senegalensis TaxID=1465766 RepID=UPI0002891973|nr:type II toxin-antitoxin system RelE/ParE family toxin [Paenibacillus senegalensis]